MNDGCNNASANTIRTTTDGAPQCGGELDLQAILFDHHCPALSRPSTMENSEAVFPLKAGLSWKSAACCIIAALRLLFTGVFGTVGAGVPPLFLGLALPLWPSPLRSSSAAGSGGGCASSSSGSTSSSRRSAALSACSALARIASSTRGCATPAGGELVPVDSALENGGGLDPEDPGENEFACDVDRGAAR